MHRLSRHVLVSIALIIAAVGALAQSGPPAGLAGPANAATAPTRAEPAHPTPLHVLQAFLDFNAGWRDTRSPGARDLMLGCIDFSGSGALILGDARTEAADQLARLLRHFNAVAAVERQTAHDQPGSPASPWTGREVLLNDGRQSFRLTFKPTNDGWRIGGETLSDLDAVYAQVFASEGSAALLLRGAGADWVVDRSFLGLRLYKWIGLFLLLLLAVGLDALVRLAARVFAERLLAGRAGATVLKGVQQFVGPDMVKRTVRPLGLLAGGLLAYSLLPALDLPLAAESILRTAAKAFALVATVWSAYRVVDLVAEAYRRRPGDQHDTGAEGLLVPLVARTVKLFILALGLVFIAESLNLPVTSLLAGVSLAGAAVAIAAKGTLENIFGTFSVIMDKPFGVGDWVKIENIEGSVENISFRSTRVRTFADSLVTIPNATVMRASVDNLGPRARRRYSDRVVLPFDTPPEKIDAFCNEARRAASNHPKSVPGYTDVRAHDFGPGGIELLLSMLIEAPAPADELRVKHEVMLEVLGAARRSGVALTRATPS